MSRRGSTGAPSYQQALVANAVVSARCGTGTLLYRHAACAWPSRRAHEPSAHRVREPAGSRVAPRAPRYGV